MPQAEAAELAAIYASYDRTLKGVRSKVVGLVEAAWLALDAWRDADIAGFVAQVVPVVAGGQQQVAALTAAYLAQQRAVALGVPFRPASVRPSRVTGAAARNGTDPAEVYRRAGIQVWRDLANGRDLPDAVKHGQFRAKQAAQTDLELTKVRTAHTVLPADKHVVGYRRTLTGDRNCALCVIASTQRYHRGELMPIHPGCDCGVEPIWGHEDASQVLDREQIELTHAAIAERFGAADRGGRKAADYRKLIVVRDHGELGRVLTLAEHNFDGPGDIAPAA